MTHFTVLVIGGDVDELMEPYDENGEWFADGSRWDWYVVGGRWTGAFDPAYDAELDPLNYSTCKFCEGTGVTTKAVAKEYPAYENKVGKPCIQCTVDYEGNPKPFPGKSRNYQNVEHQPDEGGGDYTTVDYILEHRSELEKDDWRVPTHAVLTPDGAWHEASQMGWFGISIGPTEKEKGWPAEFWKLLGMHKGETATLVDAHV